jgi:hypothetical protein
MCRPVEGGRHNDLGLDRKSELDQGNKSFCGLGPLNDFGVGIKGPGYILPLRPTEALSVESVAHSPMTCIY